MYRLDFLYATSHEQLAGPQAFKVYSYPAFHHLQQITQVERDNISKFNEGRKICYSGDCCPDTFSFVESNSVVVLLILNYCYIGLKLTTLERIEVRSCYTHGIMNFNQLSQFTFQKFKTAFPELCAEFNKDHGATTDGRRLTLRLMSSFSELSWWLQGTSVLEKIVGAKR